MDPLTHAVVGRAVAAAAARPDRPQSVALGVAAILGALSPDIDSVVAFAGWDRYLRVHQLGTHSLLGAVVMGCCTAGVVWLFQRGTRVGALLAAATAGAISHVALDLACGALIALAWPVSGRRLSVPLVAMADPWLIGICVAGLVALWRGVVPRRAAARLVLVAVTLFLTFKAAMLTSGRVPHRHHPHRSERAPGPVGLADGMDGLWAKRGRRPLPQDQQLGRARSCCHVDVGPIWIVARGSIARARHGAEFSRGSRVRLSGGRAGRPRPHFGAVVGSPLLWPRIDAQPGVVRRVGRRCLRSQRTCAYAGSEGGTPRPDSSAARVRRNSTLANGVPSPIGCVSLRNPWRAKQSRHSVCVRGLNV